MELIESQKDENAPEQLLIEDGGRYGEALTSLLNNLQGLGEEMVVGAGLARFSAQRLTAIRHAAELKVEKHLNGIAALLQVLTIAVRELGDRLPAHVIPDVAANLQLQTQELACWRELAIQAAYIREHPDFARHLAQQYVQQAEALDEWPKSWIRQQNGVPGRSRDEGS